MVWFKLSAIRFWVEDSKIRSMFRLPKDLDLGPVSHVVLSSQGRLIVQLTQATLLLINGGELTEVPCPRTSLLDTHRVLFETFQADEADCLGFGRTSAVSPVILHLVVKEGDGYARAIFHREPSRHNYALLKAIGVEYL